MLAGQHPKQDWVALTGIRPQILRIQYTGRHRQAKSLRLFQRLSDNSRWLKYLSSSSHIQNFCVILWGKRHIVHSIEYEKSGATHAQSIYQGKSADAARRAAAGLDDGRGRLA